ncbi:hypothetical protein OVA26_16100 [Microbacterium sp. SL62]|uniref:hypothetical protein n=1 Tax=Microbacterium sp. SL62 TaxID=2995139 RepID=UPI0022745798|nr:hypothetical protein [Microbacterium sp. SL62]MCY1718458.1 hypothetical protein [Microbacterium sp. SL62]
MSGETKARSRRRPILIGVATFAVAALVGGLVLANALGPERVDPASLVITPQPQQVAANDPVVAAPATADLSQVEVISKDLQSGFGGDVLDARSRAGSDAGVTAVQIDTDDTCLEDWAKQNLAQLAASGAYEVVDVCGHQTAVLAGPAGSDSKVLVYGALEETAPAGMREIVTADSAIMTFVAVRTVDGKAQLLAAAAGEN